MLLLIRICIHLVFIYSLIDIYFKSPIVKDVEPFEPIHEAPADRIVIFLLDGLRADSFANYTALSYMRSIANSIGRWGISKSRAPTESRVGHNAIIAGFYEDVSAITKGWGTNPVDFDSVFKRTTYTWGWNNEEWFKLLNRGQGTGHFFFMEINPNENLNATVGYCRQSSQQVTEIVTEFFKEAQKNETLRKMLLQKKIIFYIHIRSTDCSGHLHKPKTEKFLATLRFVDEKLKEIEALIRNFYNDDGRTTFLMTSDHGMTDWGSHGSGSDSEVLTPYVLWGAGVQEVKQMSVNLSANGMSLERRLDIDQADLAPLMATLLSVPVPVNSQGRVTVPINLLDMSLADKAKAVYSNSRQLASQYNKKRSDVESHAIRALYYPYKPFTEEKYKEMIKFTEKLLNEEDYKNLIAFSDEIMALSLSGLNYYHNYYQIPLLVLVTLSFLGLIVNLLKLLCHQSIYNQTFRPDSDNSNVLSKTFTQDSRAYNMPTNLILLILSFVGVLLIYVQDLPMTYYVYFLLPILLWRQALVEPQVWTYTFQKLRGKARISAGVEMFLYTVGCLTLSISLRHRWALSIPLVGLAMWPFYSKMSTRLTTLIFAWSNGCILLSVFCFIPVVKRGVFIELVVAAGIIWILISVAYIYTILLPLYRKHEESLREVLLTCAEILLLVLELRNIYVQSKLLEPNAPVILLYQVEAWIIIVVSLACPLLHSVRMVCRMHGIYSALLRVYLQMSVAHESLFTVTFVANAACWLYIEMKLLSPTTAKITDYLFVDQVKEKVSKNTCDFKKNITSKDFRRAFFFILYLFVLYVGIGNLAVELPPLMCFRIHFTTDYSGEPLIRLKMLLPILMVLCSFRALQLLIQAPVDQLNIILWIYSNIMALQLLFEVKNTGSWLEMGTSVCQYVIVQFVTLIIVLLNPIAKIMTANQFWKFSKKPV